MTNSVRIPRQSIRYPVWVTAACRGSMGRMSDIILADLSTDGCGVTAGEGLLKPGQLVVVRLQSLEGLAGKVVWVRGKKAGVKFDRPLYGPVVEHIVKVQLTAAPPRSASTRNPTRRV
jgi:PilZ domain